MTSLRKKTLLRSTPLRSLDGVENVTKPCTPQGSSSKPNFLKNLSTTKVDENGELSENLAPNLTSVKTGGKRKRLLLEWMRKKTLASHGSVHCSNKKHKRSGGHITMRASTKREKKKVQRSSTFCSIRCRLYALGTDSTWVDRGIGQARVVLDLATNKVSVEVRQSETKSVRANFIIQSSLERNGARGYMVHAQNFYSHSGVVQPEMFAFKFKSKEVASEFAAAYEKGKTHNKKVTVTGSGETPMKPRKLVQDQGQSQQGRDEAGSEKKCMAQGQATPKVEAKKVLKHVEEATKTTTNGCSSNSKSGESHDNSDSGATTAFNQSMTDDTELELLRTTLEATEAKNDALRVELALAETREKEAAEQIALLQQRVITAEDALKVFKLEVEAEAEAREDDAIALKHTTEHASVTLENILTFMGQVKGLMSTFEGELQKSVVHLNFGMQEEGGGKTSEASPVKESDM